MAILVNTNVAALNSQFYLQTVNEQIGRSFERLSSGSRINSARDDTAGLQISNRLNVQILGLNQASRNANDGISIAQIAEGALSEISDNIQQMRVLALQGGNTTLSADDRAALGLEFEELLTTNNEIAASASFGTYNLLDGTAPSSGFQIQSGANSSSTDTVTTGNATLSALFGQLVENEIEAGDADPSLVISTLSAQNLSNLGTLGQVVAAYMVVTAETDLGDALSNVFGTDLAAISGELSNLAAISELQVDVDELVKILNTQLVANGGTGVSEVASAIGTSTFIGIAAGSTTSVGYSSDQLNTLVNFTTDALLEGMSGLITAVDAQRAKLGAEQNGLSSVVRNNSLAVVNVSAARSRIQDTDFALEITALTRNQIIQQVATSFLAQANQQPDVALSLLRF